MPKGSQDCGAVTDDQGKAVTAEARNSKFEIRNKLEIRINSAFFGQFSGFEIGNCFEFGITGVEFPPSLQTCNFARIGITDYASNR